MSAVSSVQDFVRKYPFSIFFCVLFAIAFTITYRYTVQDCSYYMASEQKLDNLVIDSFNFKGCVAKDSARGAARLLKSIAILKERKDNIYADATWYYECTFIYSHMLGIFSILGTVLLLLVVTKGWDGASLDLKITMGAIFMTCSISYFIPKLMNNEKNYTDNIGTYYNYSKQINYSAKVLSYHCCCDASRHPDSLLNAAADSNFNVINNNLTTYYDINFNEATKYFDEFKSDKAFKKQ